MASFFMKFEIWNMKHGNSFFFQLHLELGLLSLCATFTNLFFQEVAKDVPALTGKKSAISQFKVAATSSDTAVMEPHIRKHVRKI